MIIKTYKANTNISINVVLPSKKNLHVTFVPLSNGSSVLTTDNEELQNAIERHYNYGKLFKLVLIEGPNRKQTVKATSVTSSVEAEKASKQDEETAPAPVSDDTENEATDNEAGEDGDNLQKVKVSDINEAKDYLAEKFGVSRTTMRSTKSILATAAAHGIEFEGL